VADPLGLTPSEAAHAIFRVVNANMANAIGLVSVSRGHDPRDFVLMAFGGGGPLHTGALIDDLGIGTILVPRASAPVLCALGDTLSDLRESNSQALHARSSRLQLSAVNESFMELSRWSEADMGEAARALEGRLDRAVSMRLVGQTHEVLVPVIGDLTQDPAGTWAQTTAAFHRLHEEQFSFSRPDVETEIIGTQVDRWAFRKRPTLRHDAIERVVTPPLGNGEQRLVLFSLDRGYEPARVFDGLGLSPSFHAVGPAIVQEPHTAIVVYPGQSIELGSSGCFVISGGNGNATD
jgi:N-methylhydantoinase A